MTGVGLNNVRTGPSTGKRLTLGLGSEVHRLSGIKQVLRIIDQRGVMADEVVTQPEACAACDCWQQDERVVGCTARITVLQLKLSAGRAGGPL
jgi:hypothetical protein